MKNNQVLMLRNSGLFIKKFLIFYFFEEIRYSRLSLLYVSSNVFWCESGTIILNKYLHIYLLENFYFFKFEFK